MPRLLITIHRLLDREEQVLSSPLHFVDKDGPLNTSHEAFGIRDGCLAWGLVIKIDHLGWVLIPGNLLDQSAFADLPGA